jgi:hypothetical protein
MNDEEGLPGDSQGAWSIGDASKPGRVEYWSTEVMEGGKIFSPGHNPDEPEPKSQSIKIRSTKSEIRNKFKIAKHKCSKFKTKEFSTWVTKYNPDGV